MSMFDYFPRINYNNINSINLMVKAQVVQSYLSDYNSFFTYLIKDGERPDIVAYEQYNDASLDWIILLLNNVLDPYKDWILSDRDFVSYLESKYNVAVEKLQSTSNPDYIAYYYYKGLDSDTQDIINSYNYTMTPFTYSMNGSPAGWVPKSIYDNEHDINESKRSIKLLRPEYINDFKHQFKDLFN